MKPHKVLVLGSGALKIGQAGEFDYSGSQALKALAEEGIYSVLINPNIASIQTDKEMANQVYFLPVEPHFVEQVIQKEKVDAILLSFGGQTALNCGLQLDELGILKKHQVQVLGTPIKTIRDTEDRHLFAAKLAEINVATAKSIAVYSTAEALKAAAEIGYPIMMRSGFALGGKGSGVIGTEEECHHLAEIAFSSVSQILIEECLSGWKEIEFEVVRDAADNCIAVCNMENMDPMGIHTGESIVVVPSQTLDDYDFQNLRNIALKTIRHLGIVGECNIQYALDPHSRRYCVIEVNARLSRSSALASKATGYPLAYVAAKIALGYQLTEIPNNMVKHTSAFFEPALDYIVCKFPRWDLDKFELVTPSIGTEMKSVGEVMAIGRSFAEVIQKAVRMLEIGAYGLFFDKYTFKDVHESLQQPTPRRIFAIVQALQQGMSIQEIHALTQIDPFFLHEINRVVKLEQQLKLCVLEKISGNHLLTLKRAGFSDKTIARIMSTDEDTIYNLRHQHNIRPALAQIDNFAAEYPTQTNYLYFTYHQSKSDIASFPCKQILLLGSGCYRIGSSVEFDWCAVNAVRAARSNGYKTVLLNCNPETVSTDYDICEYLVFDEITFETVRTLNEYFHPTGVIVAMGGQTANNLALKLHHAQIPILGTSAFSIDIAEDRHKFSTLLDSLQIDQPLWFEAQATAELESNIELIGGFPVLVRPSYVLSGAAMRIADNIADLTVYLSKAVEISSEHPVTISKYEANACEVEFDAVVHQGEVKRFAISEHIENAGVHSGDATIVLPAFSLSDCIIAKTEKIGRQLARALQITGPFNIQFLLKNGNIKVIECNLRASRTFPFISKAIGINLIYEATCYMLGVCSPYSDMPATKKLPYYVVKSPQFSFARLKGADPRGSVEMSSVGEAACFGQDLSQAVLTACMATGFKYPQRGIFLDIESTFDSQLWIKTVGVLCQSLTLKLYATPITASLLLSHKIDCHIIDVDTMLERYPDELLKFLKSEKVDWVISIPPLGTLTVAKRGYYIRRLAVELDINLTSDLHLSMQLIKAVQTHSLAQLPVLAWGDYLLL